MILNEELARALEIFLQQLVTKTSSLTKAKRAKTMTTGHLYVPLFIEIFNYKFVCSVCDVWL